MEPIIGTQNLVAACASVALLGGVRYGSAPIERGVEERWCSLYAGILIREKLASWQENGPWRPSNIMRELRHYRRSEPP